MPELSRVIVLACLLVLIRQTSAFPNEEPLAPQNKFEVERDGIVLRVISRKQYATGQPAIIELTIENRGDEAVRVPWHIGGVDTKTTRLERDDGSHVEFTPRGRLELSPDMDAAGKWTRIRVPVGGRKRAVLGPRRSQSWAVDLDSLFVLSPGEYAFSIGLPITRPLPLTLKAFDLNFADCKEPYKWMGGVDGAVVISKGNDGLLHFQIIDSSGVVRVNASEELVVGELLMRDEGAQKNRARQMRVLNRQVCALWGEGRPRLDEKREVLERIEALLRYPSIYSYNLLQWSGARDFILEVQPIPIRIQVP